MKPLPYTEFCGLLGLQLRPGQLAFARVAYDGLEPSQLKGAELELGRQIFGPVETIPQLARPTLVQPKGRGIGGSRMAALRLVHLASTLPLPTLSEGELAYCPIVAPKLSLTGVAFRFALEATKQLRAKGVVSIERQTAEGFTLRRKHDGRRVRIECFAASRGGDSIRSVPLAAGLLDEAAFFRDESTGVVNDKDVFNAITPRLLHGGQVLIVSSPWARSGLLHDEFQANFGNPTTALAAHCPTGLMRDEPEMQDMIAAAYARDPVNAARELGASFLENEETLLNANDVDALTDVGVTERAPVTQSNGWPFRFCLGLDVGLRFDASAIVVTHHERDANDRARDPVLVDYVEHIAPSRGSRIELQTVEDAVVRASKLYGGAHVYHDGHLADALAPRLRDRGVTCHEVKMTPSVQADRASLLVQRARSGLLRLVDHPVLIRELKGLQITRHAGGRITVAARTGRSFHDDCADAFLISLEASVGILPAVASERMTQQQRLEAKFMRDQARRNFIAIGAVPASLVSPEELNVQRVHSELAEIQHYIDSGGPLPKLL